MNRPRVLATRTLVAPALALSLFASSAPAAYFHESRRPGMLWLSDSGLKRDFVVREPVPVAVLSSKDASQILGESQAPGLFERQDGPRIPIGQCLGADAEIVRCERKWESSRLASGKIVASRDGSTLTLTPKTGDKLVLTDWEKCSPEGECDGERFLYLGPFGHSGYAAVEIDYAQDSPSLVFFDVGDGKVVAVHYGSEATYVNSDETLLVSVEDANDATTLLATRLGVDGPAVDLQCLGARTESSSFGVAFKRWSSDSSFDVVLIKAGQSFTARFERDADGAWTLRTRAALASEGFECRQRGAAAKTSPPAAASTPSPTP